MTDDFEPVEKNATRNNDDIYISASPMGEFYIPNKAYDMFFEGEEYVALGRDLDTKRVSITPTDDPEGPGTYTLKDNRGYGMRFTSKATLTELGVEIDETVRLDPMWDDDRGAVILSFADYVED